MSTPPPSTPPNFRQMPRQFRSLAKLPRGKRLAVVKGQDHGRFHLGREVGPRERRFGQFGADAVRHVQRVRPRWWS